MKRNLSDKVAQSRKVDENYSKGKQKLNSLKYKQDNKNHVKHSSKNSLFDSKKGLNSRSSSQVKKEPSPLRQKVFPRKIGNKSSSRDNSKFEKSQFFSIQLETNSMITMLKEYFPFDYEKLRSESLPEKVKDIRKILEGILLNLKSKKISGSNKNNFNDKDNFYFKKNSKKKQLNGNIITVSELSILSSIKCEERTISLNKFQELKDSNKITRWDKENNIPFYFGNNYINPINEKSEFELSVYENNSNANILSLFSIDENGELAHKSDSYYSIFSSIKEENGIDLHINDLASQIKKNGNYLSLHSRGETAYSLPSVKEEKNINHECYTPNLKNFSKCTTSRSVGSNLYSGISINSSN